MTPAEIASLIPGPELDRAVHLHVFEGAGKAPAYSTDRAHGMAILDKLPLYVARVDPGRTDYRPDRPWKAGRLQFEQSVKGDITITQIFAATAEIALCKAGLMAVFQAGGAIRRQAQPRTPGTAGGEEMTVSEKIGRQVKAKREKAARPAALPPRVNQPMAPRTNRPPLEPMPQRKMKVPGADPAPALPGGRM